MASLESLIDATLEGDSMLVAMLATYASTPAVFINSEAPADTDIGWTSSNHYPFIVIWVDKNYTSVNDRKIQGSINIDIQTRDEVGSDPEPIADRIVVLLNGVVYRPDNEPVVQLQTGRVDRFRNPDQKVIGVTAVFNLLGFPVQTTYSPDPVAGINTLLATVSGIQSNPQTWSGTTSVTPAVYAEMESIEGQTWFGPDGSLLHDAWFRLHVLAPDPTTQNYWVRKLAELIKTNRRGRILLDNDDDLLVNDVRIVQSRDAMRVGQIRIRGEFGVVGSVPSAPLVVSPILTNVLNAPVVRRRYAVVRLRIA